MMMKSTSDMAVPNIFADIASEDQQLHFKNNHKLYKFNANEIESGQGILAEINAVTDASIETAMYDYN